MSGLQLATCDRALAPSSAAPEWIHLLPQGHIKGRDGREFELSDPSALVLAFEANGIDLPIDYEHQNDKPEARLSGPVPAAGWIKELRVLDGGLWGRAEWTETAAEMIRSKEYRFLSPSILVHPKTRQIMQLKGAGLVHNPNLFLTALASQEDPMLPSKTTKTQPLDIVQELSKLLDMPPDTPADQLLAKLADLLKVAPDPAKFMPVSAVHEMLTERRAELSLQRQERIVHKVQKAVDGHYITRGMQDWALSLCQSNEAAFDEFCEQSGPMFAYLFRESAAARNFPSSERIESSPLEKTICDQLGLKPGALNI